MAVVTEAAFQLARVVVRGTSCAERTLPGLFDAYDHVWVVSASRRGLWESRIERVAGRTYDATVTGMGEPRTLRRDSTPRRRPEFHHASSAASARRMLDCASAALTSGASLLVLDGLPADIGKEQLAQLARDTLPETGTPVVLVGSDPSWWGLGSCLRECDGSDLRALAELAGFTVEPEAWTHRHTLPAGVDVRALYSEASVVYDHGTDGRVTLTFSGCESEEAEAFMVYSGVWGEGQQRWDAELQAVARVALAEGWQQRFEAVAKCGAALSDPGWEGLRKEALRAAAEPLVPSRPRLVRHSSVPT